MANLLAQSKPLLFKNNPSKFDPQPSFSDRYLLSTSPFLKIIQTQEMKRWVQMNEPTFPGWLWNSMSVC